MLHAVIHLVYKLKYGKLIYIRYGIIQSIVLVSYRHQ